MKLGGVAAAAALACAACGGGAPAKSPLAIPLNVGTLDLANGLHVVLEEDKRAPTVSVNVTYHVGGKDDPVGRSGFAHLFEHLMFQGSAHVPKDAFWQYLNAAGAHEYNGETTLDTTQYHETLPSDQLDLALWLESDRMGFLLERLDQENFERERKVVESEWSERYATRELGFESKFVRDALFTGDHPYRRLPIGTPEELDAASLDDVRAFFATYYVPANATLTIVGDIRAQDAAASVKRYFADLPARPAPPRQRTRPRPTGLSTEKRLTIEADVADRHLDVFWPAPPWFTREAALAEITIEMTADLVYWWLVDRHEWAYSVSARCDAAELASVCSMSIRLKPGAPSPERILETVDTAFTNTWQADIPRRFVVKGVNHATSDLIFGFEQLQDRAAAYGLYQQATGNPLFLARHMEQFESIDRGDVEQARASMFGRARVVALIKPDRSAPLAGRLATGGAPW